MTPTALGQAAYESAAAGAGVVHLHPRTAAGKESFDPEVCAEALRAVRAACPGLPISLSTSAEIEADPARRLALIAAWTELPDLVTVNQGERGIVELCDLLPTRKRSFAPGSRRTACACWSSHSSPTLPKPSGTRLLSKGYWQVPGLRANRFITATASPPGPSVSGRSRWVTGFARGSRTRFSCPMAGLRRITPNGCRQRRFCSSLTRNP